MDGSMAAVAQAERMRGDADRLVARYSQPDRYMEVCPVSPNLLGSQPVVINQPASLSDSQTACQPRLATLPWQAKFRLGPPAWQFDLPCLQVCGLFVQSTDSEARRRDHVEGKQYLGGY